MKKLFNLLFFVLILSGLQGQDFALKQLENSPRHHEWVKVRSGDREVNCFVVFPEISDKATVAVVIHENRGLTDWVRSFSDQLAEAGYIAVAPDLLSDFSPQYKKTNDFPNSDDARNAIYELDAGQVKNDLNAVQAYAEGIPAGNGKTVSVGFCWGGMQSFRFATYNHKLKAALVFYGSAPETASEIAKISTMDQRRTLPNRDQGVLRRQIGRQFEREGLCFGRRRATCAAWTKQRSECRRGSPACHRILFKCRFYLQCSSPWHPCTVVGIYN